MFNLPSLSFNYNELYNSSFLSNPLQSISEINSINIDLNNENKNIYNNEKELKNNNFNIIEIEENNEKNMNNTLLSKKTSRDKNNESFDIYNNLFLDEYEYDKNNNYCNYSNEDLNRDYLNFTFTQENNNNNENIEKKEYIVQSIEIKNEDEYFNNFNNFNHNKIKNSNYDCWNEEKSQCGRKTDEEKRNGKKGIHTKDSEDNKIRKIKSFFGKSLYKFIKNSFKEDTDLLKLTIKVNKSLKKDYNERLFKKKLRNLFIETKISDKYKLKNVTTNEQLIKKVYNERKDTAVIRILNLTYMDAFNIFRRKLKKNSKLNPELKKKIEGTQFLDNNKFNDVETFFNKIYKQELQKGENIEDINEYIKNIKNLILNFEDWFAYKVGRNR